MSVFEDSDDDETLSYDSADYHPDSVALNFITLRQLLDLPPDFELAITDLEYDEDTGNTTFQLSYPKSSGSAHVQIIYHNLMFSIEFDRVDDDYRNIKVKPAFYWDDPETAPCDKLVSWLEESISQHRTKKRTRLLAAELRSRTTLRVLAVLDPTDRNH